jgi:hypothetical protein
MKRPGPLTSEAIAARHDPFKGDWTFTLHVPGRADSKGRSTISANETPTFSSQMCRYNVAARSGRFDPASRCSRLTGQDFTVTNPEAVLPVGRNRNAFSAWNKSHGIRYMWQTGGTVSRAIRVLPPGLLLKINVPRRQMIVSAARRITHPLWPHGERPPAVAPHGALAGGKCRRTPKSAEFWT